MSAFAFRDQPAYSIGAKLPVHAWKSGGGPEVPGPGSYQIELGMQSKTQHRPRTAPPPPNNKHLRYTRRTGEHFQPEPRQYVPGPGSYLLPSCFDTPRTGKSFGREKRSTFISKNDASRGGSEAAARFIEDFPGPGSYNKADFVAVNRANGKGPSFGLPKDIRGVGGGGGKSFDSRSPYLGATGAGDIPGVGSYQVAGSIGSKQHPLPARFRQQQVPSLPLRTAFKPQEVPTEFYYDPLRQYRGMSSTIGHPQFRHLQNKKQPQSARF